MKKQIRLIVNGVERELLVTPNDLLLNVLRDHLSLTGTKYGCGIGECCSCTVLVDGTPMLACLMLAISCDGCQITTVEGIAQPDGELHPLQESFLKHGAIQCGFCTGGILVSAKAFLDGNPHPTRQEIREALSGNLCRCTGYKKIIDAVEDAASALREKTEP